MLLLLENKIMTKMPQINKNFAFGRLFLIKLSIIILCWYLFLDTIGTAQSITWQRAYDGKYNSLDVSEDICDAGNGNFFIVGTTENPDSYYTLTVLKINQFGDTLWWRYKDSAVGKAIVSTGDGGCIVTGLRNKPFTIKLDSAGNTVWFKEYSGSFVFTGLDIIRTSDSGYIMCGTVRYDSAYIAKLDIGGNLVWQRSYGAGFKKLFRRIIEIDDGEILAFGFLRITSTDTTRALITKLSNSGKVLSERTFILNGITTIIDAKKTGSRFLISGDTYNGTNFKVFYKIINLDLSDSYTRLFVSNDDESDSRIAVVNSNRFVFSVAKLTSAFPGGFRFYTKTFITDSLGNILAERDFNALGDLYINSILTLPSGDIMFAGYGELAQFPVEADIYMIRTDSVLNSPPLIGIHNEGNFVPETYSLNAFPNPFNPETNISFMLPQRSKMKLILYDLLGRVIAVILDSELDIGKHEVHWRPKNLSSGVYFLQLCIFEGPIKTTKLLLTK